MEIIKLTKDLLNSKFEMKELGEIDLNLRAKAKRSEFSFSLNHDH